jgi:Asp/Glu/hydantoin racemase
MGIRIWHQAMADLDDLPAYKAALAAHAPRVVAPDTEVVLHGARRGSYLGKPPAQLLKYPYIKHLIVSQILDHCRAAEEQGFDAVALATFAEPFLQECRSLVSIPIASMPESTLLVGCSLAHQMALITLTPKNVRRVQALVDSHGLGARVSGVYSLTPAVTEAELNVAFENPKALLDNFIGIARRAIAEGADAIIPAEGVLAELVAAKAEKRIDDVPVIDTLGTVLGYAEMLVHLRRRSGLEVGRQWSYARPDAETVAQVRAATRGS